jgi:hypothetical protein
MLEFPFTELNMSYSTTSQSYTKATGGFPLGDLNWFPTRKAAWIAAGKPTTAVGSSSDVVPSVFTLDQNYPNPFNPSTTITFSLPVSGMVTLDVYNILGTKVSTLVRRNLNAGSYTYQFDGTDLPSGVYVYRISVADKFQQSRKMTLVK